MTADARILRKIESCLALSASSNEAEAAAALRQAMKLMQKYNIDENILAASSVEEAYPNTTGSGRVIPKHLAWLASVVADAFEVRTYSRRRPKTEWISTFSFVFYGVGSDATVAAYAFDALAAQIEKERRDYMKTIECSPAKKQKMATQFCQGWVLGVNETVKQFAGSMDPEKKKRLDAYAESQLNLRKARSQKSKHLTDEEFEAHQNGSQSGKKARLYAGAGYDGPKQAKLTN